MYRNEEGIGREEIPRDEMLLDVCLEEILSGQAPPDMSAQILAAVQRPQAEVPLALPIAPPLAEPPLVSPPVAPPLHVPLPAANGRSKRVRVAASSRRRAQAARRQWNGYIAAAALAFVGLGIGLAVLQSNRNAGDGPAIATGDSRDRGNRRRDVVEHPPAAERRVAMSNPFAESLFGAEPIGNQSQRGVPWKLPYAVDPQDDAKVIEFVNERLSRRWTLAGVAPAAKADDDQWCRRVFQQTLGREPSSEEVVDFATSKSPDKREALVAQLLGEQHRDEFARHWADVWTDALLAQSAAAERQIASREGLQDFLYQSLRQDKPLDQITTELLTATGSGQPGAPDFNGATNLVLSGAGNKSELAATVGRVFLGHHGQCAQCHDAPGDRGLSQQQFWQLASFFQQTAIQRDETSKIYRLADVDYVGPTGDVDEAEIFYDQPDGQRKIAYPVFVDGTHVSPAGRVDKVNRRVELARLVTGSEEFSQATVNQLWAKLLGDGLAGPTGNSHPELLQRLGEQFAAHKFDQKRLIQWIVLSEANARSAEGGPAQLAGDALFSRFAGPAAKPPAMYDSVASALASVSRGGRPVSADRSILFARRAPVGGAGVASNASIFVRSPTSTAANSGGKNEFVGQMIASDMTFGDKVDHLFLQALARRPTPAEASSAQRTLSYHDGNIAAALDDIWWAIANSSELH